MPADPPLPVESGQEPDPSEPAMGRLQAVWQVARSVGGVLLLVAGVLGLVLPVIPGVPLLIAGVALLGPQHWLVRPFAEYIERWRAARRADRRE